MENIFELLKGGCESAQTIMTDLDKKFAVRIKRTKNASSEKEFHNKKSSSKLIRAMKLSLHAQKLLPNDTNIPK